MRETEIDLKTYLIEIRAKAMSVGEEISLVLCGQEQMEEKRAQSHKHEGKSCTEFQGWNRNLYTEETIHSAGVPCADIISFQELSVKFIYLLLYVLTDIESTIDPIQYREVSFQEARKEAPF